MHSVIIEIAKLILVGTRITYQATGDAGCTIKEMYHYNTHHLSSGQIDHPNKLRSPMYAKYCIPRYQYYHPLLGVQSVTAQFPEHCTN